MARKKLLDPIHPGEILLDDFMKPMGLSINRLARDIVVQPGMIRATNPASISRPPDIVSKSLRDIAAHHFDH